MKQINNTQTKDFIAQAIRNEILAGNIKSGEELTQESLAETLGVSRMPVREALQTLVQEGFIERLPNRHMQVVALDKEQIEEIFQLICCLEVKIFSMIFSKNIEVHSLVAIIENFLNTKNVKEQIKYELAFHDKISLLLENKYIEQMRSKLMLGYVSYAIENLGEYEQKSTMLLKIKDALESKKIVVLEKSLLDYYMYYSDKF